MYDGFLRRSDIASPSCEHRRGVERSSSFHRGPVARCGQHVSAVDIPQHSSRKLRLSVNGHASDQLECQREVRRGARVHVTEL